MTPFEVYAIRYASSGRRRAAENYLGGSDFHNSASDLDYYIWVIRRGDEIILVDTGFTAKAAAKRGKTFLIDPVEALANLDIEPGQVADVIITHLHYDHAGNMEMFPNARFHLQASEAAFATGPCMCDAVLRNPYSVDDVVRYVELLYAGRMQFHDGASELCEGVSLHRIGGHTAGLQVVRIYTARGWIVLASDAVHLYGNLLHGIPFPVLHNVGEVLEGYRQIRRLSDSDDHIVAGHDPLVMERYPAASDALNGIVATLHCAPRNETQ